MGLSAHDRQELELIEEGIASSDAHLAAMLSAFSRLAVGEAMPQRERIATARKRTLGSAMLSIFAGRTGTRREQAAADRPRLCLSAPCAILTWLVISVTLVTIAVVIGRGGAAAACAGWPVSACARPAITHHGGWPLPWPQG